MKNTTLEFSAGFILLLAMSCSGGSLLPVAPGEIQPSPSLSGRETGHVQTSTCLWGVWDIEIDPTPMTAEAVPFRGADFTCNVTRFIDGPPVNLLLSLGTVDIQPDYVDITLDIGIRHPFPGLKKLTGFDVLGVFLGDGSDIYPGPWGFPVAGVTDQRLLNPDGYTRWFNSVEFGGTSNPLFGYSPGALGSPGYTPSAMLNPYRYFADGLGKMDSAFDYLTANSAARGSFTPGATNERTYHLRFPKSIGIRFQYAVIAHWKAPGIENPSPADFPPSANADEAPTIRIEDSSDVYFISESDFGGSIILDISAWDWSAGCSGVMDEYAIICYTDAYSGWWYTVDMTPVGGAEHYCTFHAEIPVETLTSSDPLPVWIEVIYADLDYTNEFGIGNDALLAAYFLHEVAVSGVSGWADTWGGTGSDRGYAIAVDSDGYCYVSGYRTATGGNDLFLSKHNPAGEMLWEKIWGGDDFDCGYGVALDGAGNIYVAGSFQGSADFDPGDGIDIHDSSGLDDACLSKFDSDGNFLWARTWGGTESNVANAVAVGGLGNICVAGQTAGEADFDPGGGTDLRVSAGSSDAFLSVFDADGDYLWAQVWGGTESDSAYGVSPGQSGSLRIAGSFMGVVDFNPDGGAERVSSGAQDAFMTAFDSSGVFQSVLIWGGPGPDEAFAVCADGSGNAFITGVFDGTVDFDPGAGIDSHDSNGLLDIFLTSFDPGGAHRWARTWGGTKYDDGYGVAADISGNIYVTGGFMGLMVDFDPGSSVDARLSEGDADIYLSKFDSSGAYQWARTFGGIDLDRGRGVGVDGLGNACAAGRFRYTVDFAPTGPPCGDDPDSHSSNGACDVFLVKFLPDGCW